MNMKPLPDRPPKNVSAISNVIYISDHATPPAWQSFEFCCLGTTESDTNTHLYERELTFYENGKHVHTDYGWKELYPDAASAAADSLKNCKWVSIEPERFGRTVRTGSGKNGGGEEQDKAPISLANFNVTGHGVNLDFEKI